MSDFVSRKFSIPCNDGLYHDFDGYEAQGKGLGYYINPPDNSVDAPEYLMSPKGLRVSNDDTWYIVVYLQDGFPRRITEFTLIDEEQTREIIEDLLTLTDWTQNIIDICNQPAPTTAQINATFSERYAQQMEGLEGPS